MVSSLIGSQRHGLENLVSKAGIYVASTLVPIIIPIVHLGYIFQIWNNYTRKIDREACSCSCWDTAFKANYEAGVGRYKHVYFNVTWESSRIWILIVLGIVVPYETTKYILKLAVQKRLRISMVILILSSIFPHYYGLWGYFNYYNDDYFDQWYHQMYYSITEGLCTLCVMLSLDKSKPIKIEYGLFVLSISLGHILSSGYDQFMRNVIFREGIDSQILRDIGLMIPDILHFAIPVYEIHKLGASRKIPGFYLVSNKGAITVILFVISIFLVNLTFF